jgi:acyl carrier protein
MTDEDVLKQLSLIVSEETGDDAELTRESTADDVPGWDSVAHSRIMLRAEQAFKVRLDTDVFYSLATVGDLIDYLRKQMAA